MRGKLPEYIHLVGIQPEDLSIGIDLSPTVSKAIPDLIERARSKINDWGLTL